MDVRIIHPKVLFILGCLVLAYIEGLAVGDKTSQGPSGSTINPTEISGWTFSKMQSSTPLEEMQTDPLSRIISESLPSIERSIRDANALDKTFFDKGIDNRVVRSKDFYGPHLLTSSRAKNISHVGLLFIGVTKAVVERLKMSVQSIEEQFPRPPAVLEQCPFHVTPDCSQAATSRYRNIDGSCNNLKNGFWGASFTPLERMLPAVYDYYEQINDLVWGDTRVMKYIENKGGLKTHYNRFVGARSCFQLLHTSYYHLMKQMDDNILKLSITDLVIVDKPRQTSLNNLPLPLARIISTRFHLPSVPANLQKDLSQMTMEFGQFLSHDIQRTALATGHDGANLQCCTDQLGRRRPNCFAIEIPTDDPYYSQFNRTCMNFVRAFSTPNLDCSLGQREQLNQNTHYIDGSQIYGSEKSTSDSLRSFTGGTLITSQDPGIPNLLPKDTINSANCILPQLGSSVKCFIAGDVRVNQQPALASLHTIFMREHNRIATGLGALNNSWSDQILFDEARKIVGAILQHITYKEYLPEILGSAIMNSNGLNPLATGYFEGYQSSMNPSIRNEFATAAFRFGHSMVHDSLKYRGTSLLFKDVFNNPTTLYDVNGGIDSITIGLVDWPSQKVDERLSQQVTRHLFERQTGFGADLAAINIQRGRDHGIPSYLLIRSICNVTGNVHSPSVWSSLNDIYNISEDIDLFPAGVSENPVAGAKVGKTFACIIAKQFEALKKGDRYYYENSGNQAFTPEQLDEIRTTTLSKVICRNTGLSSIPSKAFRINSPWLTCSGVSDVDYSKWKCGWSNWESWTPCVNFIRFRLRTCTWMKPCPANICPGNAFQVEICGSFTRVNIPSIQANIRSFESILSQQQNNNGNVNISAARNLLQNLVRK